MRQKNIHGYPLMVPSLGQTVYPGQIVEYDVLIPGFEKVDDSPEPESEPGVRADETPSDETEPVHVERADEPLLSSTTVTAVPGADIPEVTR